MLPRAPRELIAALRASEYNALLEIASSGATSRNVILVGASGIGKSTLLKEIVTSHLAKNFTRVIDLGSARCRSSLGLATSLLQDFDPTLTSGFFELASNARKTRMEKPARDALKQCENLVMRLAPESKIFVLDNVDRASSRVRSWLFRDVLAKQGIRIISSASQVPTGLQDADVLQLEAFNFDRLQQLAQFWAPDTGMSESELSETLVRLANGHPVLAALVSWALHIDPEGARHSLDSLYQLLTRTVRTLSKTEVEALSAAVFADQRLNATIFAALTNGEQTGLPPVADLPFISELDDPVHGFVVHPIAIHEISKGLSLSSETINSARKSLVNDIYPRLMSYDLGFENLSVLELERLRYLARLGSKQSHEQLERAFRSHLHGGRLSYADEIAHIAIEATEGERLLAPLRFALMNVENSIARHDVEEAATALKAISSGDIMASPPDVHARVGLLRAKCVTSPAAVKGDEIFDAVGILQNALKAAQSAQTGSDLAEEIQFELGQAYRLIARTTEAVGHYQILERQSHDILIRLRAIEEEAQLLRLMQDLSGAEAALNRATSMRLELGLEMSRSGLYYLANIRRDQGQFAAAEGLYARALELSLNDSDDYLSCVIFGDWAWMKFLDEKLDDMRRLVDEYRRLADVYGFQRELAEYWHMQYHLETVGPEEHWDRAYSCLDQALRLAKKAGNIVMQLDCMMHLVQKAVRMNQFAETVTIINEMKSIEDRGCGIKVFRGRALVYQGDGYLNLHQEKSATLAWKEGFEIIAGFGQSRSNTELLSDILSSRKNRFGELNSQYEISAGWPDGCEHEVRERILRALAV